MKTKPTPLTEARRRTLDALIDMTSGWFYPSEIGARKGELLTLANEGKLDAHGEHGQSTIAFKAKR